MAMLCFGLLASMGYKEFERDVIYPPGRSRNGYMYQEFLHVGIVHVDLVRRHFACHIQEADDTHSFYFQA